VRRNWLPEAEIRWREEPLYEIFEKQGRDFKLPFESLRERKRRDAENAKVDWDAPLPKGGEALAARLGGGLTCMKHQEYS
jgi:hypothetical protein